MFSSEPEDTRIFVKRGNVTRMGPGDFLRLTGRCGLELSEVDLAQLARRELIMPWEGGNEDSWYTELHLYVVAEYLEAVRPTRHPWATSTSEVSLDQVSSLAAEVNEFLDAAFADGEAGTVDERAEFVVGVERFLARIDPFGPLGGVFDLLQAKVVAKLRNSGRLYLEVRGAITELSARLQGEWSEPGIDDEPKTEQMYGVDESLADDDVRSTQVIGESETSSSAAAKKAIDDVVSAAAEASEVDEDSDPNDAGVFDEGAQPTQLIEIPTEDSLAEESSAPIVLLEDDVNEASEVEEDTEKSDQARELDERLEKFGQGGESSEPETTDDREKSSATPPPSPVERIAELNRRREVYMKEQAWNDLVDLYEDGIGLFANPEERQQIFLALAMLYEVKLRKKGKAFDTFARAWAERAGKAGRDKAMQGLQRLGKKADLHERYLAWLREQLSKPLENDVEVRLQKEVALALFADEKYGPAFSSYASFLAADPERNLSEQRLGQLALFGEHVEDAEVDAFFDELRELDLNGATLELIEEFAGD